MLLKIQFFEILRHHKSSDISLTITGGSTGKILRSIPVVAKADDDLTRSIHGWVTLKGKPLSCDRTLRHAAARRAVHKGLEFFFHFQNFPFQL